MRTAYSPLLPLLVFSTIMLSSLHPSACRHVNRATYEEEQQLNTEFSLPLPRHPPANIAHTVKFNEDDKVKKLYAASHKLVPGGPNPLHNWLDLSFFVIICFHEKSLMHTAMETENPLGSWKEWKMASLSVALSFFPGTEVRLSC